MLSDTAIRKLLSPLPIYYAVTKPSFPASRFQVRSKYGKYKQTFQRSARQLRVGRITAASKTIKIKPYGVFIQEGLARV
jgi:hypothetical protein